MRSMSELAKKALSDLERRFHVVGVARDCDDRLTFLLDRDDKATRSAVERWAKSHAIEFSIRVIGKVVSG
jgi:hypothetical protein